MSDKIKQIAEMVYWMPASIWSKIFHNNLTIAKQVIDSFFHILSFSD